MHQKYHHYYLPQFSRICIILSENHQNVFLTCFLSSTMITCLWSRSYLPPNSCVWHVSMLVPIKPQYRIPQ